METRILLVDDEDSLRALMRRYLERLGYQVDACATAAEAWESFRARGGQYVLAIVDLVLPDTRGEDLVRGLAGQNGALPFIVCSGAAEAPEGLSPLANCRFLQKPFVPHTLAATVNAALAGQTPAAQA